ncbi:MAG: FtsQ-type POTRA domain-containing protein [Anaerovibrio sp.]|nr:FtsQ-type POTRA domain-containing protein [Anaerovibrio sp.]
MEGKKHKMISQGAVATILAGLIAVLGILACALSPIFVLKTINIQGNRFVQNEEIIRIAGVRQGENLFQLKTDEIKKNLTKDLRIDQAVVQRSFPSQLDINIVERVPLALVKCDYGYLEAGRDGIVLDAHRTLRDMPVPIISGVAAQDLFVGDVIEDENINRVLLFLSELDEDTIKALSEINISNPEDVMVYAGSVQIRLGSLEMLPQKVEVTESAIKELQKAARDIVYVDARFNVYSVRLRQQ